VILVTHPRAGSEWFLDNLKTSYGSWEMFSGTNWIVGATPPVKFPEISVKAKLAMLKSLPSSRSHKIQLWALEWATTGPEADATLAIIEHLKTRDDVYLLRRKNTQLAIVSLNMAIQNYYNYHRSNDDLVKPFEITRAEVQEGKYHMYDVFSKGPQLNYRETFWYEDLLAGQNPSTLEFDRTKSKRQIRNSVQRQNLLLNAAQVKEWMAELEVPGSLQA
jgi:hypothetical protein